MAPSVSTGVLSKIAPILNSLIAVSREKQEAIVSWDVPALEKAILSEQELIAELNSMDLGLLAEEVSAGCEDSLKEQKQVLREKIALLKELDRKNSELIDRALWVVRSELALFLPKEGYQPSRKLSPVLFDKVT